MIRLVLILLIALLPLRGWNAERMAVYMAAGETTAVTMVAGDQAMPADCPMMMEFGSSEKGSDQGDSKSHRACQSCQLCMALATFGTEVIKTRSHKPPNAAVPRADRFASADQVRVVKPPIS